MKKQYQVTLICADGRFRPVSTIVYYEQDTEVDLSSDKIEKGKIIKKGVEKVCCQRYWNKQDLTKNGYTRAKVREYDRKKIEQQKKENYERIKEEKYASGEWIRPKNK